MKVNDLIELDELRALVAHGGVRLSPAADESLMRVLAHVGDAGVAADAILQVPRPLWLWELIGYALGLATGA